MPGQSIEQSEQALAAPSTEQRAGRLIQQSDQALAAASSDLFKKAYAQDRRAQPKVLWGDQPVKYSSLNLAGLHEESVSRHVENTVAAGAMAGVTGESQDQVGRIH